MRLALLPAAVVLAALVGLSGCVADGGYGGYGYDYDYYDGPDVGIYPDFWGPGYYVGPGHFHGHYGGPRGPRGGHRPPYRSAPAGRPPPSMPPAARGGFRGGGGRPHGR